MGVTQYFLIKWSSGRAEICSMMYEAYEHAEADYNEIPGITDKDKRFLTICRTINPEAEKLRDTASSSIDNLYHINCEICGKTIWRKDGFDVRCDEHPWEK